MSTLRFPTRRYPYRRFAPHYDAGAIESGPTMALEEGARRLVLGVDPEPIGRLLSSELILCGGYGDSQRHSDRHIGAGTNAFARQGAYVTLANPVGIYFAGLDTQSWRTPDGTDPAEFWKIVRGTQVKPVRAVLKVPDELGYSVGDITISGRKIEFGGQVADHVTMKLTAVASGFGTANVAPMTACRRRRPQEASFDAAVEAFSARMARVGAIQGHR